MSEKVIKVLFLIKTNPDQNYECHCEDTSLQYLRLIIQGVRCFCDKSRFFQENITQ